MLEETLTKHDANASLDLIDLLLNCTEKQNLIEHIHKLDKLIHIDYVRCVYGDKSKFRTKKMAAFHLLIPFPLEWEERYHSKNYLIHDPVALATFQQPGLIHWSEARNIYQTNGDQQVADEASSFGLKDGWIFSLQGRCSAECAVVSISGKNVKTSNRTRTILQHILPHLCQAVIRIYFNNRPGRPMLTQREREVLTWIARGKSAWDISMILGISCRTVEFHTGNILKKMDAINSPQAVALAMDYGLLNV